MTDARDHAQYADWDGAYVLGALSPAERREFEAHLETCDRCRLAVADLSGLPGLLGRVETDRAFELLEDEAPDTAVPPPAADLVARIEAAEHRRRTRRRRIVAGLAAAAVIAGAIAVPVTIAAQPHPTVAVALRSGSVPLTADLALTDVKWGTRIDMHCAYTETAGDDDTEWDYGLWVVDQQGNASEVSTWKARTGSQVRLSAATSLSVSQIASIQVRSATTGDVLLSKKL
jgi:anti-sigma-K factor RskA